MDGNPPPGHRGVDRPPSPPPARAGEPAPREAFGPLAVRRITKDDGRSLIAYERLRRPAREGPGEDSRHDATA